MFAVSVARNGVFRFIGINAAHEDATGLISRRLAGRRPEDVLPRRLARNLSANLRDCLRAGERHDYAECLDLPAGRRHWKTTLNPIKDGGEVYAIVGLSVDACDPQPTGAGISPWISAGDALRKTAGGQVGLAEPLRGTLGNILTLAQMLAGGDVKQGDIRATAALVVDIAAKALIQLPDTAPPARPDAKGRTFEKVDVGRHCRDFAALVDPGERLSIDHPEVRVLGHDNMFRHALAMVADCLTGMVESRMILSLHEGGARGERLTLAVEFDGYAGLPPQADPILRALDAAGICASAIRTRLGLRLSLQIAGRFEAVAPQPIAFRTPKSAGPHPLPVGLAGRWQIGSGAAREVSLDRASG